MSLARKRLDEILATSIEDIENMFCWKIDARTVNCPRGAKQDATAGTAKRAPAMVNIAATASGKHKRRKLLAKESASCFSAASSSTITSATTLAAVDIKVRQPSQPPSHFILEMTEVVNDDDDFQMVPSIDMIDIYIRQGRAPRADT